MSTLPVLVGGLMGGLTAFTCVAVALGPVSPAGPSGTPPSSPQPPFPEAVMYAALAVIGAVGLIGYFAFGRWCTTKAKAQWKSVAGGDAGDDAAANLLMTTTLLRAALIEGPGLLGAVIILLTGSLAALAAPAITLTLLAMLFPVRSRLEALLAECRS